MSKQIFRILSVVLIVMLLGVMKLSAQLNETFDNLNYGVPYSWDNSSCDNVYMDAWFYYASGYQGAAVACRAVDVPVRTYAELKTPMLSNLPAGCILSFACNAPSTISQMSVSVAYGIKTEDLGVVRSNGWEEFSFDLSKYAGKSITIIFRIDCGGKATNASEWYILDNVKVGAKPNCAKPIDLTAISIAKDKVSLQWMLSSEGSKSTDFDLKVRNLSNNTDAFYETITTIDNMFVVEGLTPSTNYEVQLKANCSALGQGISDVATLKFTTLCGSQNLTYSHSFDGWSVLPDCWLGSKSGVTLQDGIKIGASAVRLTSTSNTDAYIISPQFNHKANDLEIAFSVYGAKGTKFSIFLTPDPTDLSQAIPLWEDEEILKTNEWQHLTFNTIITSIEDKNMAVVIYMPSGIDATMYVDEFKCKKSPSCPRLENLVEIVSDSTFTTIDWSEHIVSGEYEILLSKDSLIKADSIVRVSRSYIVDSHPCTINGLEKNKKYEVKVRAICAANDSSVWSNSISIHTSCGTRAETIFVEDFESGVFPPECWFARQTVKAPSTSGLVSGLDFGDEAWALSMSSYSYDEIYAGNYAAKLKDSRAGIHTILVTQPIYVDIPSHYDLSVWLYRDEVYGNRLAKENEGLNIWVNNRPDTIGGTKLGFVNSVYTMYPVEKAIGWYNYEYNIPISGNVYIIFEGVSGGSYGMFIDNVEVKLSPLCRKVTDVKLDNITTNSAKISWKKGLNEEKWSVNYTLVSGQSEKTEIVTVEGSPEFTFSNLSPGTQYTLSARIISVCSSDDRGEVVMFSQRFETDCDAITLMPYIQTFDEERFPPHCWKQYQSVAYGNPNDMFATDYKDEAWVRNDDKFWNPELIKSGDASAKLQKSSSGIRSALITPQFTFEKGKEYVVEFWMYRMPEPHDMDNTSAVDNEGLNILLNDQPNVDGATKLGFINVGSQFIPQVDVEGWYKYEFTVASPGDKFVIFEGVHQGTMSVFIDNVVIREATSCGYVDIKIDSIKTTVARVSSLSSDVQHWQVSVGAPGFNPNGGTLFDAEGSSVTITGLTPQTDYELYARRKCDNGTYGPWSEFVSTFATQCEPIVVDFDNPFLDGFENFVIDDYVFGCYQQEASTSGRFVAKTGAYNDNGECTLTPYEGDMFAVLPYNNDTWLFRPFELKANSNYEVSVMGRQDCDFGMNLNLAYFVEPEATMVVDTLISQELVSEWKEYKGWINVPSDGVYYIGVNITTWGISVRQYNSVLDNFSVKEIECAPPVQIKESKITAQSAEVDFHSIADVWEVKVASVNFDPEYAVADIAHDTIREKHYEIDGLETNKEYYYAFRSLCKEPSPWSHVRTFRTVCSTFELPYYDDFEDPELNNIVCWNSYLTNPNTSKSEPSTYATYEGKVAYKMYESITILPQFNVETLANYLIRGYIYASKNNAHVSIGVIKDISNPIESFVEVSEYVVAKESEWHEFIVYFSDLAKPEYAAFADAKYIAFAVTNATEFFIDNIEVVEIPTCLSPTEVFTENVTTNSCEIRWYENGAANRWQVNGFYKNELVVDTIVLTNPAIISGLNPSSTYNFKIRSVCSDVDQSWWSNAGEITTECSSYLLPYDQAFTGLEQPQCWKQGLAYPNKSGNYWIHTTGAYYYKQPYEIGDYNEIIYLKDYTSMLVSPIIDLHDETNVLLSFDLYNSNSGEARVLLSLDGGETFDIVLGSGYKSQEDTITLHYDLSDYVGNNIAIGIEAKSSAIAGSFVLIDNFSVEAVKDCKRPVKTELVVAYDTYAKFVLTDTTLNTNWQYVVGSVGFDPYGATPKAINTKKFEIQNLNPLSNYEIYVRSVCGTNSYSDWRGPVEFQTACLMDVDFPYYEGFEGITKLEDNCFKVFSFKSAEEPYPTAELNTRTYLSAGSQGLLLVSSPDNYLYFALPLFEKPLRELKISFDYRTEYDADYPTVATPLELGVMSDLNVEQSYTRLVKLPYTSIHGFESYFYSFADADAKIDLSDKYIVFRYSKNPRDRAAIWAGIDNIEIVPTDYCYKVDSLVVLERKETSVSLSWKHENISGTTFEYRLLQDNKVVKGVTEISSSLVVIKDLVPATDYQFEVRCKCSDDNYSDWETIKVRTLAYSPTLPYVTGFEDEEAANWVYCGEGQTNYFVVGSDALGVKSGDKALYITNNGIINEYSIGATSSVYAYRLLSFEPGQYRFSYSWKCQGEHTDAYSADYGKVYLAPVEKGIVAGKRLSTFMDAVPGCIMLGGDKGLNKSSKWNDVVVDVVFKEAVSYNLVVEWYNNASGGAQTPFAIDDISVSKIACPMPESVQLISVDDVSAKFAINTIAEAEEYEYRLSLTDDMSDCISSSVIVSKTIELTNLTPNTDYYLFVCAKCGEDGSSNYQSAYFHTERAAAELPYSVDFSSAEENSQWVILNGKQKNGFVMGGKDGSLYISSEPQKLENAEYSYDSNVETATYAYRLLNLGKGQYSISFDWRSEGSKSDYGRIFLVPATYNIESAKRIGNVNVTTNEATLPAECIALDGGAVLAGSSMKLHAENPFFVSNSGRYKLVVQWYNKGNHTGTLPLWIDNVEIDKEACAEIDELNVFDVDYKSVIATFKNYNESKSVCAISTSSNVDLAFALDTVVSDTVMFDGLAGNTTYYLFVKSQCFDNLDSEWEMITFTTDCSPIVVTEQKPYFEGFEDYVENSNLNNCWELSYKFYDKPVYVTSKFDMSYNAYPVDGAKYLTLARGNNIAHVSRQFYLEKGVYYSISAWSIMSQVEDIERGKTTIQLMNYSDESVLAEREVSSEAYREIRRIFVPQATGIYDLGFTMNVGMSVVYANVDNFKVEVLKFGSPDQLEVDSIAKTYSHISWVGIADRYQVQLYRDSELLVDEKTIESVYAFENLSPATTYTVRVRGLIDSPAQESDWVETFFTTECDVALPTFTQNFENVSSGTIPVCWDNEAESTLADYTKNWSVKAESGNKSITVNTSELYGTAVIVSPLVYIEDNTILSYSYRNLTYTEKLRVELRGVGSNKFSEVILEGGYSGWQQKLFDLSAYKGDTIQLAFSVEAKANKEGGLICVDDVRIACYAGETTDQALVCQGEDFVGYGFNIPSTQLFVGENRFSKFVVSNSCDTLKHLEVTVNPLVSSHTYDTICRGDIYMWGEIACIETNVYEAWYRGASSCGCDSVAYLHLEVLDLRENIYATICEGDSYKFGDKYYTETGIYVDTIPNENSCDSVKILTLVVISSVNESYMTICEDEPLYWNDTTLQTSGRYVRNYKNINGCDSVEIINLTVLPKNIELEASICKGSSILFGARELTEPGVYVDSMVNVLGCDSIVTLYLAVSEASRGLFEDYVCEGYEYIGFGFHVNAGVIVSDTILSRTITTLNGCDSIVELHIEFIPTSELDTTVFILDGEYYDFGEQTLTKPGKYSETFVTALGCDSIVNLTLEIGTELDNIYALPLTIAPNPVTSGQIAYINHEFTTEEQRGLYVEIVNSVGQVISSIIPTSYPIAVGGIDVSGLYYVRITTGVGDLYVGKLIVK